MVTGINLRGYPDSFSLVKVLGDTVVYEIDAHCRQPAMVEPVRGILFKNVDKLLAVVRALKGRGLLYQ